MIMKKIQLERLKLASSRCKKKQISTFTATLQNEKQTKNKNKNGYNRVLLSALANRLDFNLIYDYYMSESHFIFANDPDFICCSK